VRRLQDVRAEELACSSRLQGDAGFPQLGVDPSPVWERPDRQRQPGRGRSQPLAPSERLVGRDEAPPASQTEAERSSEPISAGEKGPPLIVMLW